MRHKTSLNFKIGSVVAVMAIGSVLISWIGLSRLSNLEGSLTEIVEVQGKRVRDTYQIQKSFASLNLLEVNFLLDEDVKIRDERENKIASEDKFIRGTIDALAASSSVDQRDDVDALKKSYLEYLTVSESARKLAKDGKLKEAIQVNQGQGRNARHEVESSSQSLLVKNQKRMADARAAGSVTYSRARTAIILTSLFSLSFGLLLALWTMRAIGRSISQAIRALRENSTQLNSAAQSVASTSTQISQASTEQASVVQETASSIEEMSSMVAKNSESASRASEVSGESQKSAVHGKEVVEKMIHSIQEIDSSNSNIMEQIGQSNQQLAEIVRVISEIATKTQVINDIVFQTKLLSFNASVEAARAGEHGKGFAVVAEEVGNLAQMSGNAAREITGMLDQSIQKVETIVQDTKSRVDSLVTENKAKVSDGVQVAKECGSVLDEIVARVSNLTEMASNISSASQEQAHGVREITQAMSQLDQVTQQNAATSEQAANAASQLSNQAKSLENVVFSLAESIYGKAEGAAKVSLDTGVTRPARSVEKTKAPKAQRAEVIRLPVKLRASIAAVEEPALKLKTAGVGSAVSLPSPDDERFKDI